MPKQPQSTRIVADASLNQAKKNALYFKNKLTEKHHVHGASLREATHSGHHITIKTTYTIHVDGKKFKSPLNVSNSGNVQYHGMPNIGFSSAIDLMKAVVDQFPSQFSANPGLDSSNRHINHKVKENPSPAKRRRKTKS